MAHPMMAVNPVLSASAQQSIPLVHSPFGPPIVDRAVLSSTIAPTDPRQFCVPSQFGSSVLPNANMLSSPVYSGWGILPPESIKAVTRRNEMVQRHHTARAEMKMYAFYQQRRMERAKPKELAGLGVPFLYGSSTPDVSAAYHGRSVIPASDLNLHRSALRNLQGTPILVATEPHLTESWGQKCHQLRRSTGNQKHVDRVSESCKGQAQEILSDQTHTIPREDLYDNAQDPETICTDQKSRENNEKPTTAFTNSCGDLQPSHRKPSSLEEKAWDEGKEKLSEQGSRACDEKNMVCPPVSQLPLPGTCARVTLGENHPWDEDIQKWTVDDVYNFIRSLPGCSDYAQLFKDHAIDGETLPLLTEEHLRGTMGLKLGPALKIQAQVSQHMGNMFYKKSPSPPTQTRQAFSQTADAAPLLNFNSWSDTVSIPCSQDIMVSKTIEQDSV